jgi:hypothetical protein
VILKKLIEAAAKLKILARNFSCGDLPNEGCSPRWVSPLDTDAGKEFELLPPTAVSGGDA